MNESKSWTKLWIFADFMHLAADNYDDSDDSDDNMMMMWWWWSKKKSKQKQQTIMIDCYVTHYDDFLAVYETWYDCYDYEDAFGPIVDVDDEIHKMVHPLVRNHYVFLYKSRCANLPKP